MPPFAARRIGSVALMAALFVMQGSASARPSSVRAHELSLAASPTQFAKAAFETTWRHTDAPVSSGNVKRTWFWGPSPNSFGLTEDYKEGISGKRLVQYFDKSRMEINNPAADPDSPWYVTNGLLTVELISGRMQTGDNSYSQRAPANINVTGDEGDATAPTYASFASVSNAIAEHRDPDRTGQDVIATLDRAGHVGQDLTKAAQPGARIAYYEKLTGHNIPAAMWTFLNATGPVEVGSHVVQQRLMEPWFYASGLPISDPYWAKASIAGKQTDVLVQAYERRVLTYVPTNPAGFQVEMGNVGQHYYRWRYSDKQTPPLPAPQPAEQSALAPGVLPRFAVDPNGDLSGATLGGIARAGAGAVRAEMPWASIEPNYVPPANYNWASMDSKLKQLAGSGLSPIVLIDNCPKWACDSPDGPIRPTRVAAFVEFTSALVERYSQQPYNARYWEFWNEPDNTSGPDRQLNWGMHPDQYAAMLQAVRPGMKAADPNAKVVMGGLAYDNFHEDGGPFNRRFLDDFLSAGGGQYLDVFNFHYYVQNVHWCSLTAKLNELRAKLAAYKVDLPIICSETGFTSNSEFGSSPDTQSLYVAQAYAQAFGEHIASVAWYTAKDFQTNVRGWQIFKDSGLLDVNNNLKPSYYAYKWAATEYGQRKVTRSLNANDGVTAPTRGYEFGPDETHAGALWVFWAWDFSVYDPCGTTPNPHDFTIPPAKASQVSKVLDMYGNPLATHKRADGTLVFPLDAKPVYVEWR